MGSFPETIAHLVKTFADQAEQYTSERYNETQCRIDFINPMFKALGWDMDNTAGYAEAYREVIHEDALKIGSATKAPDYSFRIGGTRKFFLEAKKPAVAISTAPDPAYQLRRYAWNARLGLSVLTNFDVFAAYDGRVEPKFLDKASTARVLCVRYSEYAQRWNEIEGLFSREAILKGKFDKFTESGRGARGTATVDDAFLTLIEDWREKLARNLALRNHALNHDHLNYAVQQTIDRIVFLRMCEDRGMENYEQLRGSINGPKIYQRLQTLFIAADDKYNSGLFHFKSEKDRPDPPDEITPSLEIDDKLLKEMIEQLYYPKSNYLFSVIPPDILGHVYEQFLGKVIRLTEAHQAKIEEKPEVRKAGGVYYTPTYIVDYIVRQTVGKLLEGKTPKEAAKLKILDPACGSGSFLLGAFQHLLDWHLHWYTANDPQQWAKGKRPTIFQVTGGAWRLTTAERKRILLDNIFGVDIDPQAVEVTKLSLLLAVLIGESRESLAAQLRIFHERALPDLAQNIRCGNSLIGSDFYKDNAHADLDADTRRRINAFDWDSETHGFGKIIKGGGFDAVIGNPPYGAAVDEMESTYLRRNYKSPANSLDTFLLFVERGGSLLKQLGLLGVIIPSGWTSAPSAEPLRRMFLKSFRPLTFVSLPFDVFRGAYIDTVVLTAENAPGVADDPTRIVTLVVFPQRFKIGGQDDFNRFMKTANFSRWLQSERIEFLVTASDKEADLLAKIRQQPTRFNDVVQVKRGIETYEPVASPRRLRNPILAHHGTLQRYDLKHASPSFVAYPPDIQESKPIEYFSGPRILLRQVLSRKLRLQAVFAADTFLTNQSVQSLIAQPGAGARPSLCYLLGILNSKLMSWYFRSINSVARRDDFPKIIIQQTRELPLCQIDFTNKRNRDKHDRLVGLVDQMLSLHKSDAEAKTPQEKEGIARQIEATDGQIDQLVYELYGLSEAEIRLVEEGAG